MLAQKKYRSAQEASTDLAMSRQTEFAGSHIHPVIKLQRTIGNHAVQRLLHAKAEGAKAGLSASNSACFALDARHNLESRVQRARESGQPLPKSEHDIFEPRLGDGLSQDKIHTDTNATPLNRETKAHVITTSKDKLSQKREGSFRISKGRTVLAHGATHTDLQTDVPQIPGHLGSLRAPTFLPETDRVGLHDGQVAWKKHPKFPDIFGQVYYARKDIDIWPSFNLEYEWSWLSWGWQCKPSWTNAIGATWRGIATPENLNGYRVSTPHPSYPNYDYYVRVSGKAAKTIAAAEQQHVDDLDLGWQITGKAVANAINLVNLVANAEPLVRSEQKEAKKAVIDKVVDTIDYSIEAVGWRAASKSNKMLGKEIRSDLEREGRLEVALGPAMDNAYKQSKKQRDDTGKHNPGLRYVMADHQKQVVVFEVNENFVLDKTPSSDVVNLDTIL